MKSTKKGLLLVIISGIVFGIMPSAVTFCYSQGANRLLMVFFRYLVLILALLPFVLKQKNTFQILIRNWWKFLILSVAGVSTPLLLYTAYSMIPTGVVTTIHYFYPTLVAILCVIVFREKLSKLKLICLALCITGILLMMNFTGEKLSVAGILVSLASSLTWSIYIVLLDKFHFEGASSMQIMFGVGIIGAILLFIVALCTGSLNVQIAPLGWLAILGTCLVIAVCGSLFFAIGVRETDA